MSLQYELASESDPETKILTPKSPTRRAKGTLIKGLGERDWVWGLGFRVWSLGFRVEGSMPWRPAPPPTVGLQTHCGVGFGVKGLKFRVYGLGLRVAGLGLRV